MNDGPDIRLEPFTRTDVDRLIGWIPDARFLHQWTGPTFLWPLDRRQLRRHLAEARRQPASLLIYKAVDGGGGGVIGHGEIAVIDRTNRSATLARILVGPKNRRGRGVGERIVGLLLEKAFTDLDLHRVDLRVFDFNEAAVRCYEKAGFRKEGLMRDSRRVGDEYWSVIIMSVMEEEWRESPAWRNCSN